MSSFQEALYGEPSLWLGCILIVVVLINLVTTYNLDDKKPDL